MEAANVVVVRDELATLPHLAGLARQARRVVEANPAVAVANIIVPRTWPGSVAAVAFRCLRSAVTAGRPARSTPLTL
jgi:cation transport ATPase